MHWDSQAILNIHSNLSDSQRTTSFALPSDCDPIPFEARHSNSPASVRSAAVIVSRDFPGSGFSTTVRVSKSYPTRDHVISPSMSSGLARTVHSMVADCELLTTVSAATDTISAATTINSSFHHVCLLHRIEITCDQLTFQTLHLKSTRLTAKQCFPEVLHKHVALHSTVSYKTLEFNSQRC